MTMVSPYDVGNVNLCACVCVTGRSHFSVVHFWRMSYGIDDVMVMYLWTIV